MHEAINLFCARIGADPLLVQGAGGNVSWKDGEVLWVKASGTWLSDALTQTIFVPVALPELQARLRAGDVDAKPRALIEGALRPSIETLLHALMPQRIVVHLHAIEVLARLVREDFERSTASLMPSGLTWLSIPYEKPGAPLAQAVAGGLLAQPQASTVFLQNHGVVLAADSLDAIDHLLDTLIQRLATPVPASADTAPPPTTLHSADGRSLQPVSRPELHQLATRAELYDRLHRDWALYPDHVVFLGPQAICHLDVSSAWVSQHEAWPDDAPQFIRGLGVFTRQPMSQAKLAQLGCYHAVLSRQTPETQLVSLDAGQVSDLLGWDAEKHRQQLSR